MTEFFLQASDDGTILTEGTNSAVRDEATLTVLGLLAGKSPEAVLDDYLATGELSVDGLEGNFSLALVDNRRLHSNIRSIRIYRHLVGSDVLYYADTPTGFCCGSNLATVARRSGLTPRPNESVLPSLFLYRIVPERETLFDGIFKLMPGELVSRDATNRDVTKKRTERRQLLTMEHFLEARQVGQDETIDRLEAGFDEMLSDWFRRKPKSAVLLSGGVDSMYVQVHWNRIWRRAGCDGPPPSAAIVLDHPATKPDYDYTMSAVERLGTEHLAISQSPLTAEFMSEVLSATAEMPNHVQSFYFATLAEGMKQAGFEAGISGVGADGVFGNENSAEILAALKWQRKIPVPLLRSLAARLIDVAKPGHYLPDILRLTNHLDDTTWTGHPLNRAMMFADYERCRAVFGEDSVTTSMAARRKLLDDVAVPDRADDPHRLWRTSFVTLFGAGVNTGACWNRYFLQHGVSLYNPFQDSRVLRAAINLRTEELFVPGNTKQVLKRALEKHVDGEFIRRPKLSFGQPIFQWLSPGGVLRNAVQRIDDYPWLPKAAKREILENPPNWFLWTLLCYDLWYKAFVV